MKKRETDNKGTLTDTTEWTAAVAAAAAAATAAEEIKLMESCLSVSVCVRVYGPD